jgi:hypothetical protein
LHLISVLEYGISDCSSEIQALENSIFESSSTFSSLHCAAAEFVCKQNEFGATELGSKTVPFGLIWEFAPEYILEYKGYQRI